MTPVSVGSSPTASAIIFKIRLTPDNGAKRTLVYWCRLFPYDKDTDKLYDHISAPVKAQKQK